MNEKLDLEIGDICFTHGGWKRVIIWKRPLLLYKEAYNYYAIHKPNTVDESDPIFHDAYGKIGIIKDPNPIYDAHHPADIATWQKEEIEQAEDWAVNILEKMSQKKG